MTDLKNNLELERRLSGLIGLANKQINRLRHNRNNALCSLINANMVSINDLSVVRGTRSAPTVRRNKYSLSC
jgi:hypothetical protein